MSDRNNPIKFGPEWLRNFTPERNSNNSMNNCQNTLTSTASSVSTPISSSLGNTASPRITTVCSGGATQGASVSSNTSSNIASGGISNNLTTTVPKVLLAKQRYGKEEMLACYDKTVEPPEELKYFDLLYKPRGKSPEGLNSSYEETNMNTRATSSAGSTVQGERFNPGRDVGRGTGIDNRVRSRMSFVRQPSTVRSAWQMGNTRTPLYNTASEDGNPLRPRGSNNGITPSSSRSSSEQQEWYPNRVFRRRHFYNTNWRQPQSREEGDKWRSSDAARSRHNVDKWNRDWCERVPQDRAQSWNPNRRTWIGGERHSDDNLPEWAVDNTVGGAGTFDSTGAFHGYSSDDACSSKVLNATYTNSQFCGAFMRSNTDEEGSEDWWASDKAKKLSEKKLDDNNMKLEKFPNVAENESNTDTSKNQINTNDKTYTIDNLGNSPLELFIEDGNTTTECLEDTNSNEEKNKHLTTKFLRSKTYDVLIRSDIDVEEVGDDTSNFQSVMITQNNSLRQKHQNIVASVSDNSSKQSQNSSAQILHSTLNDSKQNADKFMEHMLELTLDDSKTEPAKLTSNISSILNNQINSQSLAQISSIPVSSMQGANISSNVLSMTSAVPITVNQSTSLPTSDLKTNPINSGGTRPDAINSSQIPTGGSQLVGIHTGGIQTDGTLAGGIQARDIQANILQTSGKQHGGMQMNNTQPGVVQSTSLQSGNLKSSGNQLGSMPPGGRQPGGLQLSTVLPGSLQLGTTQQSNIQPSNIQPSNIQPSNIQSSNIQPSNVQPSNVQPSNIQSSNIQPSNIQPSNIQPSAIKPSTVQPNTIKPSSMQPSGMQPNVMQTGTMQPGAMQPGAMQPGAMQPGAMQSGAMQPGAMQPGTMQPGAMQSGAMQPGGMQPGGMQPGAMQPGGMQPGAMQPGGMQPGAMQPGAMQPGAMQPGAMHTGVMRPGGMQLGGMQLGGLQMGAMQSSGGQLSNMMPSGIQGRMQQGRIQQSGLQQGVIQQNGNQATVMQQAIQRNIMQQTGMQQGGGLQLSNLQSNSLQSAVLQSGMQIQNPALNSTLGLSFGSGNNGLMLPMQGVPTTVLPNSAPGLGSTALQGRNSILPGFPTSGLSMMSGPNVRNSSLFLGQNSNPMQSSNDPQLPNRGSQSSLLNIHNLQLPSSQASYGPIYNNVIPVTPGQSSQTTENPADQWYYQDPENIIQGPFSSKDMYKWYTAGFFSSRLLVRRACETHMRPLGSYGHVVPFAQIELQPFHTSNSFESRTPESRGLLNPGVGLQDSLWSQLSSPDLFWMQPTTLHERNESRVNNLPPCFWDNQPSNITSSSLMTEDITKDMKTEDEILEQLRAAQNSNTAQTLPFINDQTSDSTSISNKPAESYSPNAGATPDLEELQKLIQTEVREDSPSSDATNDQSKMENKDTEVKVEKLSQEEQNSQENNLKQQQNQSKVTTEIKPIKTNKTESDKNSKSKENNSTKSKTKKSKEEKKDEVVETKNKEEAVKTEQKRSTESSPSKGKKEDKQSKKELERERKEWVKEGFTVVKANDKSIAKDTKKKVEDAKCSEDTERKRKEEDKVATEDKKEKKSNENQRKQQDLQLPYQACFSSLTRKSPWSVVATQAQASVMDSITLTEIQRLEREKKMEQVRLQQQMMQIIAQQQAAVLAREQEMQVGFGWVTKKGAQNLTSRQTFAEVQTETRKQVSEAAATAAAAASQVLENTVPSSALAGSNTPWGIPGNSVFGFWDTLNSKNGKTEEKPQEPQNSESIKKNKNKKIIPAITFKKEEPSPSDEFDSWCTNILSGWSSKIDVPTFITFLKDLESPYEVKDYVKFYLGESKDVNDFARQFLEKRSKLMRVGMVTPSDDLCSPAVAVNPRPCTSLDQELKNKGKKGKKKKMQKVDSRILGFSVTASEDRINIGDIDTA